MINYNNNLVDYGHYRVGDQVFINKIAAILEAERTHQALHFIFNDSVYETYKWNVEPTESLESLYAARAWEIRNRYDYLVLHFSGGADSANILETFAKNKIPLEEVFLRGPLKFTKKDINDTSAKNMYAELWFNAYPNAQEIKAKYLPNLKITVVDTTDFIIDYYKKNPSWYTLDNGHPFTSFTPGTSSRADWDAVHPDFQKITESGKRLGHIFGVEKPLIYYKDGDWYVNFLDKFLNIFFVPRKNQIDLPMYQEAFYWAPSTAKMIIKQAHLIKNYITINNIDPIWFNNLTGRVKHNFIANIIYNRTLPMPFNPSKYSGGVVFPWDEFFFKDPYTDHVKNWHQGMQYLQQHLPKKWLLNNKSIYGDLIGIYSQNYKIS